MTTFLDTAVFMYAAGGPHPLKWPCSAIVSRVADGSMEAATSAEVVQEILHRYSAIGRTEQGLTVARDVLSAFKPVLAITDAAVRRLPGLVERHPRLTPRDLLHVATCLEEGIDVIITPDRGFDAVTEIKRLDPFEAGP